MIPDDDFFMREALKEAEKAFQQNEIPVGAVLVHNNRIVARAYNQTELLSDISAHAEILLITSASAALGAKFLSDFTMYVTLEPCAMCAGAMKWARLARLVYGASDEKAGYTLFHPQILHPKTQVSSGVEELRCSNMLKEFFKMKRI